MQFNSIEKKWRAAWKREGVNRTKDSVKGKKNFYHLVMFPYPSGDLHIGHWYNFAPADTFARFKRMTGNNVLSPIGFDAFGLPAENAAIKRGIHPRTWTYKNIKTMTAQLEQMGTIYDWDRTVITADPEYYRWTQWIFLQLFHAGLAYRTKAKANWCPKDNTVLANEQVVDGRCERCGTEVVQRDIDQWLLRITDYSERLLNDLEGLDWPEKTKTMQRNWIGRSEGTTVRFGLDVKGGVAASDSMKFEPKLVPMVLSGEKFVTYRLQPKDVKVGEVVEFLHAVTKQRFALARITKIERKTMGEISHVEAGHEPYKSRKEMYAVMGGYYGTRVADATPLWAYTFELIPESVEVFTTRVDTIFGCTYLVVAPEHPIVDALHGRIANRKEVAAYVAKAKRKLERERLIEEKEKTGVRLEGVHAINPFTGDKIPVYVADYVLGGYGTGAVMAVPAHDERDFAFAKKFGLAIVPSIVNPYTTVLPKPETKGKEVGKIIDDIKKRPYTEDGVLINSGSFSGMDSASARDAMAAWLADRGAGAKRVNYKLRDWLISRQRYWGSPIPLVHCEHCKARIERGEAKKGEFTKGELANPGWVGVQETALPVPLPTVKNYLPTDEGKSPLAHSTSFMKAQCPKCGGKAARETDTMDTFMCSSWYYLRYPDPKNAKRFADPAKLKAWLPVDMYIGGAEHTVLHLLYARFFTKALYDLKLVGFKEPFHALRHQGTILGPDGQKMSKSKGNVIDPDDLVRRFGADSVRMYLCFMGPYDQGGPWQPGGMVGIQRFLQRIEHLYTKAAKYVGERPAAKGTEVNKALHQAIKKITDDLGAFRFNTAVSALMVLFNSMDEHRDQLDASILDRFLVLLAPFAPHFAEELYRGARKHAVSVHLEPWPKYNAKLAAEQAFDLIIQVNGKVRDTIRVEKGVSQERARELALASQRVRAAIPSVKVKKIIFVPDRLINLVVEP